MIDAVRNYLRLFQNETPANERSLEWLAKLLDDLLVAYHGSNDTAPETDARPPKSDYENRRAIVQGRFPDLGYYALADPEEVNEKMNSGCMIGDAIDDLADIYGDLIGVSWLWENSGEADAVWHFRFGYQTHWGRHLLDLRSYLHWKLYES